MLTNKAGVVPAPAAAPSQGRLGGFVKPAGTVSTVSTEGWPPLLRHAQAGNVDDVSSALEGRADPNATAPDDDRTPLFWAAWEGHDDVVVRLLQEPIAANMYKENCKGRTGVPPHPISPMEAAHVCWGTGSNTFAAFGVMFQSRTAAPVSPASGADWGVVG